MSSHKISKSHLSKGILFMLLAFFFFGTGNALVKATAGTYTMGQILSLRSLTFLCPLLLYIFFIQKKSPPLNVFKTPNLKAHIFRGFIVVLSLGLLFTGFTLLPFANAISLGFTCVLFMSIISIPFLKEKITPPQWASIFIGFSAVLVIARPDFNSFSLADLGTLCMLVGGLLDGITLLYPRKLGQTDSVLTILLYYALFSFLFALGLLAFQGWVPFTSQQDILMMIGIGTLSLLGQICVTFAFQHAPAGLLSPLIYSVLLWAVLYGYFFWGEVPDRYTLLGAAILILSGLYVIYKSHRQSKLVAELPLSPEAGHQLTEINKRS